MEADALGLVGVERWVVLVDGPAAQETEVFLYSGKGGACYGTIERRATAAVGRA